MTITRLAAAILAAATLAACHSPAHPAPSPTRVVSTPSDTPASPQGYTLCDPINAPELCDPDDNPQDRFTDIDDTEHPETWIAMIHADHPGYDPYLCLVAVADTTIIRCDDGWTESS